MYKRILGFLLSSILFLFEVLDAHPCNQRETSFYAISSLVFYLEEISGAPAEESECEKITIEEEDVSRLWAAASRDPLFLDEVVKAKATYHEAIKNFDDPVVFKEFSKKSKAILKKVWTKLNKLLLELEDREDPVAKSPKKVSHRYPNFDGNPSLTGTMKTKIKPYLVPLKNPIKTKLDSIFKHANVIETEHSLSQAGFNILFSQANSFIRVAKHPKVPHYLFKLYPHAETRQKEGRPGWEWLVMRCQGAENIRKLIIQKRFRHFTVPDKWLYPLPTLSASHPNKQPIVLVVTDMKLVSQAETIEAWKNKITRRHLDELYCIISHGYSSTYLVHNIPYTKKGKFSCIDTEHPKRVLRFKKIKYYLSDEMNQYWDKLVREGGRL